MSERSRLRLLVLRVLVLSLLVTLASRLWYLQVLAGPVYQRAASNNQIRQVIEPAARGEILDDVGRPLVRNQTALVVSVDRAQLVRQHDGGVGVLRRLAAVLHTSYADLHARIQLCGPHVGPPCWKGSPYQPIPVSDKADTAQALEIEERSEDFPGVTTQVEAIRQYPSPDAANAAHLLGYLGPITDAQLQEISIGQRDAHINDLVGKSGLEEAYNSQLAGQPGVRQVAVDSVGAVVGTVGEQPPVPGDELVTSLDAGIQRDLEQALAYGISQAQAQQQPANSAAGVVLDAQTGHILAMASLPSYDPNVFTGGISEADYKRLTDPASGNALFDKAVSGEFAPGSTFKLISTSGALVEGTASFSGIYDCPSQFPIGNTFKSNFEGEGLGPIDLHTTIVKSCDTVYYGFAVQDWNRDEALIRAHQQPVQQIPKMARAYGLGSATGVDLPGEASGLIQDRQTKYRLWKTFYGPNACKGAKNPNFPPERRALDQEVCTDGYRWEPGDEANFDIGQGTVLVTPLQLAAAYAALVNGGKVYSPRIGKAVIAPNGKVVQQISCPVRDRVPISSSLLEQIAAAMYDVPKKGTAQEAFTGFPFNRVAVGGKTGTAQVGLTSNGNDTSWFASFAGLPGQPARYVSVITIPKGGQGAKAAAPATRMLWDRLFGLTPGSKPAFANYVPPTALPAVGPPGATRNPAHPAVRRAAGGLPIHPPLALQAAEPAAALRWWWP